MQEYQLSGIKTIGPISITQGPTLTVPTWDGAGTGVTINTVTLNGNITGIHIKIMAAITDPSTVLDMGTIIKEGITTRIVMETTVVAETDQPHRISVRDRWENSPGR